jgi:hypothetical protein
LDRIGRVNTPEKSSAPGYAGWSQHPHTPRSETPVGSHMHSPPGISGAISVPEAFPRRASAPLSGLLLAGRRVDSGPGERHAHRPQALPAGDPAVVDDLADGPVGPMGCPRRPHADGYGDAAHAAAASSWGPVPAWRLHRESTTGAAASAGRHDTPAGGGSRHGWRGPGPPGGEGGPVSSPWGAGADCSQQPRAPPSPGSRDGEGLCPSSLASPACGRRRGGLCRPRAQAFHS